MLESDYVINVLQLKYLVLSGSLEVKRYDKEKNLLMENVNKHLEKGWKPLGGVQIAGAGGDSSEGTGWSEWCGAQSLICCDC